MTVPNGEFALIDRWFRRPGAPAHPGVALGIGDDCALLAPAPGMQLAVSSDMLVEGRHFFAGTDPERLGHKALAVNLSDLAAMGARPLGFTLALALPRLDEACEAWLDGFTHGLFALADAHGCTLVGGDTTAGPLNICITVFGEVPEGAALLRSGALAGDDLWVSGTLGDARLALDALRRSVDLPADVLAACRLRLEAPTPRVALGQALRGLATAAIDVSDGLLGDVGHVLRASEVGARIDLAVTTNLIAACAMWAGATGIFDIKIRQNCVLAGGDDYELAFTAPPTARDAVAAAGVASATPVTRIGRIEAEPGIRLAHADGTATTATDARGFDHFA